ncbi:MAG: hypothetical protein JWP63_6176 [Candidatus Solibacter sp.]|nr:hypothetical protein [Candidatus Solibacter sp.]
MELVEKDGKVEGRIQPRGGAVRPIVATKMEGEHLVITVNDATQRGPATTWDVTVAGDKLSGVEKRGDAAGPAIAGVRAPALKRSMPKTWGKAEPIFNGKDLTGWEPIGNAQNSKWVARDGELVNDNPVVEGPRGPSAANIKTTRKFDDFKLHIEVNCPEHGNSGIYLRGRYEIQVGTEGGTVPSHEMGAVYGHFAPAGNIGNKLGQWTSFDITLVGRYVTVVRDGVKIHDNVELPGPTGGALDSNEGEAGPFFLQGDHQGVIRYRNITIQEAKK